MGMYNVYTAIVRQGEEGDLLEMFLMAGKMKYTRSQTIFINICAARRNLDALFTNGLQIRRSPFAIRHSPFAVPLSSLDQYKWDSEQQPHVNQRGSRSRRLIVPVMNNETICRAKFQLGPAPALSCHVPRATLHVCYS